MLNRFIRNLQKNHPEVAAELKAAAMVKSPRKIERISVKDWAETHPQGVKCGSDRYYTDLANRLQNHYDEMIGEVKVPDGFIRQAAMGVASYLEDLVGDGGVWNAMRAIHARDYNGIPMPVYEIDREDYFSDDVNIQDLQVIIWQALARTGRDSGTDFMSPFSPAVYALADETLPILAVELERAPEATRLRHTVKEILASGDIFNIRRLGLWISCYCPLTATPGLSDDIKATGISDGFSTEQTKIFVYDIECQLSWMNAISFMGCPTARIVAEIARSYGFKAIAERLDGLETREMQPYLVETIDGGKTIVLANGAGEKFDTTIKSIRLESEQGFKKDPPKYIMAR